MQIQKSYSNSLALTGIPTQNVPASARRANIESLKPVAAVEKSRRESDKNIPAQRTAVYPQPADKDKAVVRGVVRKLNSDDYSNPKTFAALSAYSAELNAARYEEQNILSKMLGIDYYV